MGCVLYVCTLGRRPFGSGGEALGKIVRGQYRKPREVEADYPEELERIVMRALASDRELRYQTAEEMRFELEQWLLTRPRPTQHSDVARLVRERISDDRRKMIDALTNVSRAIPAALANRFISPADKTATPTATSGIVMQPAALARLHKQASSPTATPPKRPLDDEATLLSDAARAALTPTPPATAESTGTIVERSMRRLPWLIALAAVAFALLTLVLLSRR
jgi:serine/threonine-protein kinase